LRPASPAKGNQDLVRHDQKFLLKGSPPLAGVDEAGRGPLAGPVVAAAVIIQDPSFSVRIDDSKKLSARARELAFDQIMQKCLVATAMRPHDVIDRINIQKATVESMEDSVKRLPARPRQVLVDGTLRLKLSCPAHPIIKGDGLSLAIACASIVAKVTRDRMMLSYHAQYPQYAFDQNKGYGTSRHLSALRKHGPCLIHRRSFEPMASMTVEQR